MLRSCRSIGCSSLVVVYCMLLSGRGGQHLAFRFWLAILHFYFVLLVFYIQFAQTTSLDCLHLVVVVAVSIMSLVFLVRCLLFWQVLVFTLGELCGIGCWCVVWAVFVDMFACELSCLVGIARLVCNVETNRTSIVAGSLARSFGISTP